MLPISSLLCFELLNNLFIFSNWRWMPTRQKNRKRRRTSTVERSAITNFITDQLAYRRNLNLMHLHGHNMHEKLIKIFRSPESLMWVIAMGRLPPSCFMRCLLCLRVAPPSCDVIERFWIHVTINFSNWMRHVCFHNILCNIQLYLFRQMFIKIVPFITIKLHEGSYRKMCTLEKSRIGVGDEDEH